MNVYTTLVVGMRVCTCLSCHNLQGASSGLSKEQVNMHAIETYYIMTHTHSNMCGWVRGDNWHHLHWDHTVSIARETAPLQRRGATQYIDAA